MQFVNSKNLPILQNQALCASGTCHAIVEFRGKVKDLLQWGNQEPQIMSFAYFFVWMIGINILRSFVFITPKAAWLLQFYKW